MDLKNIQRQIDSLANRLMADVRPGHPDYISKKQAGAFAAEISREMSDAPTNGPRTMTADERERFEAQR